MRKAILIGLDGATFDLLEPLMEQGHLPCLKRLAAGGVRGRLRTVIPPGTGPAWSTIITGLDPSNHGIADLIVRADDSYDLAFLNAASLRAPTVWDWVGEQGGKVLVLNVPMTYPPKQVNGLMVTGLLTPAGSREYTYPPELAASISRIEPSYRITPTASYVPGREAAFLAEMAALVGAKSRLLAELAKRSDWDFIMQVFSETDFLQHALWHVLDRSHPRHRAEARERHLGSIIDVYARIDAVVGEASRAAGEDASVLVMSDHGAGPLHEFIHANNLLLAHGMLNVKRGLRSRLKYLLFRAGLTPLNVYKLASVLNLGKARAGLRWTTKGYGLLRRFFFSFSDIDWPRSVAYAISGGVYGGLFVNLKGREPAGVVPQDQYERVRADLKKMLLGLRHPSTGKPLVREVVAREEIYGGKFLAELPDLYFLPSDPTQAVFGDFEFSSNKLVEPASAAISAQHRMDGVFIAAGPGIRRGVEVGGLEVSDITPMVLYMMGLAIPEGLDGKVKTDVFEAAEIARRPPAYFKPDAGGAPDERRRATDDESVKQRLKGLGYIS
jgi:predicted AlkP superfamily phosphohydrolase/phosphomutase